MQRRRHEIKIKKFPSICHTICYRKLNYNGEIDISRYTDVIIMSGK